MLSLFSTRKTPTEHSAISTRLLRKTQSFSSTPLRGVDHRLVSKTKRRSKVARVQYGEVLVKSKCSTAHLESHLESHLGEAVAVVSSVRCECLHTRLNS
jgi:hypothetical protein